MNRKSLLKALVAAGCTSLALAAAPASATAALDFQVGASTLTVLDGSANDSCAAAGLVCFAGTFAGFDLTVNVGRSFSPNVGGGIDLQFAALNVGAAGNNINIRFGDQGFNAGAASTIHVSQQMGGTTDGSIIWNSGISSTNSALFSNIDQTSAVQGPAGPGAFSSNTTATYNVSGPFALIAGINITETRGQLTTGDYRLKVPEPASLALLGLGLMAAGFASRRKQR